MIVFIPFFVFDFGQHCRKTICCISKIHEYRCFVFNLLLEVILISILSVLDIYLYMLISPINAFGITYYYIVNL